MPPSPSPSCHIFLGLLALQTFWGGEEGSDNLYLFYEWEKNSCTNIQQHLCLLKCKKVVSRCFNKVKPWPRHSQSVNLLTNKIHLHQITLSGLKALFWVGFLCQPLLTCFWFPSLALKLCSGRKANKRTWRTGNITSLRRPDTLASADLIWFNETLRVLC